VTVLDYLLTLFGLICAGVCAVYAFSLHQMDLHALATGAFSIAIMVAISVIVLAMRVAAARKRNAVEVEGQPLVERR
jgi:ABC-type nickel/cobalt efflux system permease component RcnA